MFWCEDCPIDIFEYFKMLSGIKLESVWNVNKLLTIIVKGGK